MIEMDANAKIGWNYIKNDPHNTSENGQILLELIDRQCLKILNCSPKCEGVISRQRITIDRIEQSVIDYVITCDEMSSFLSKMTIDDDRKFVLSKFFKGKTIESDHNIISAKFNLNYDVKKPEIRQEIFDFKSQEGQMKFYRATSYSNKFGSCFNPNFSPEQNMNKYFKTLNDVLHQCFNKIRIRSKGPNKLSKMSEIQMKIEELSKLKDCLLETKCKLLATILRQKIQDIGDQLSDEIAEKNVQKISDQLSGLTLGEGGFSQTGFWRIKSKICPKNTNPPLAKRDKHGNLITSPNNLKQLYLDTYKHRLRHRSMENKHSDIFILKSELWRRRFGQLKEKVTNPWSASQFEKAIKSLKNNQARDPMGIINELFKPGLAGAQLKFSTLSLMNQVKQTMKIPRSMQISNITSIWKKKGSQQDMSNERGIFVLTAVRKILDKLTYLDKYPDIEMSMSGSNIGARRNRNIRDHLFIIHGVINAVVQGEDSCIDIQVYDLQQAFDALWLEDTLNDLYDYLPDQARDDKLALIWWQ